METALNTTFYSNRYGRLHIPKVPTTYNGRCVRGFLNERYYVSCNFQEGSTTGRYIEYHYDEKIKIVGDLEDDLEEGLWCYYKGDSLLKQGHWFEGKEHGEWVYYHPINQNRRSTRQRVRMRGHFEHGKPHGIWKMYTEANALASEYTYVNGVYHGDCFVYYPDTTVRIITYNMGTLTNEQLFAAERNAPRRNRMVVQEHPPVNTEHLDLIDALRGGGLLPAIHHKISFPQDCPLSLCPIETTFVKCTNNHSHYFSADEYAKYAHATPENAHRCPVDKTYIMDPQQYHV